jgi:transposase
MRKEPVMKKATRYVGLDVHADTIAVAVAEPGRAGEVRSLGIIPNRPESIRKLVDKLKPVASLRCCYEAGPTGYALYWQLVELGVDCTVVAPTLIPVKPGDRIKTDRRDALKLARCFRSNDLTAVWVPSRSHEALRDLVRARESAKKDQLRARHRLGKFLLRHGRTPGERGKTPWGTLHLEWLRGVRFEHAAQQATMVDYLAEVEHHAARILRLEEAIDDAVAAAPPELRELITGLQSLRGIAKLTATTLAVEIGNFTRFSKAPQLMAFAGIVPSEHSSGGTRRQGAVTKTGNAHIRRVLFESAWCYRHRPGRGRALTQRQRDVPEPIKELAWKAQHRLHRRYSALSSRGKPAQKVVTAVARELLGFVWAIAVRIEATQLEKTEPNRQAA